MGVKQSCTLDNMSNLCDMHTCIDRIEGRASNSASDTDTWIAQLTDGTTYNGEPIDYAFLKIGINPASIRIQHGDASTFVKRASQHAKRLRASLGLRYEFQVYERIIRPILDNGICNLFLQPYLVSYNCRYEDLLATLTEGLHGTRPEKVEATLDRNLNFIMNGPKVKPAEEVKEADGADKVKSDAKTQTAENLTEAKKAQIAEKAKAAEPPKPEKRRAIHDLPADGETFDKLPSDVRFMVLTTQYKRTVSYYEYLRQSPLVRDNSAVFTQLLVALYVMEKSKLMHNDLHGFNILIEPQSKPIAVTYDIQGIPPFTVVVQFRVKIFDFDHASCELLGPNPLWHTDGFEPNKDLACLYKWLLETDNPQIVERSTISALFGTRQLISAYKQERASGKKDERWCDMKGTQISGSLFQALQELSKQTNEQIPMQASPFPFVIRDDMFMQTGEIYKEHRSKRGMREKEAFLTEATKECIAALDQCKRDRADLENRLNEMQANVRQLRRIIHDGPMRAFPKIQRPRK